MKTIFSLLLAILFLASCKNPDLISTELASEQVEFTRIGGGVYTWEYKGHEFMGYDGGGLIHAPYCDCSINNR